jgi:uncharacterized membrane protein YbhN (UPF0104 family)
VSSESAPEQEAVSLDAHADDDLLAEQRLVPKVKPKSKVRWAIEIAITFLVLAGMFVVILPRITGSSYEEVWKVFGAIEPWEFLLLAAVWLGNLWTYTPVLTNSLPGLTHPQAFTANLATSAVSNVLPFGGAVGVAATYLMYGSWGFTPGEITRSVLVTGVWNVLVKMALPVVALVLLTFSGEMRPAVVGVAVLGLVVLAGTIAGLWLVLRSDAFARAVGRAAARVLTWIAHLIRRPPVTGLEAQLVGFRHESQTLIAQRWVRLSVWIVIYNATQYVLLLLCLWVMPEPQPHPGWVEVFAAFTIGRLLSNVTVTPSGLGFVEAGIAAALVAAGGDPASMTAAVLLFSAFTYLAEIPVGAVSWLVWATRTRWRVPVGSRRSVASRSSSRAPSG